MAVGILVALFIYHPALPEVWEGLANKHPQATESPIFPMMFISIACGAISGFHATQSPMMARCMTNEKQGRPIFFGAMISEGIVALIWAAAATYFFFDTEQGAVFLSSGTNAAEVVEFISKNWIGTLGSVLVILGVIFAPITSADTAFRSTRLMIADFLHIDQKPFVKRLWIAVPLFAVALVILIYSIFHKDGFEIIWRYFAWANQTLAVFTLWAITVYLARRRKPYIITLIPALFMTMVCTTFILMTDKIGFGLPHLLAYILSGVITIVALIRFFYWNKKDKVKHNRIKHDVSET
jgi:carbon starvation protein CstA